MLEGLDQIDWGQIKHAYGPATDVPDLLRALASDDKEVRKTATTHLCGNIWHQGTVYQATAYAVPFLLELLDQPTVADKDMILGLLQNIATGTSYYDVHQSLDHYQNERNTPEFQAVIQKELAWVEAARSAVIAGIPRYLQLLADSDPEVRSLATYVAVECRAHMPEVEQALQNRLMLETDPMVRAVQLIGLAYLWWRNSNDAFEEHPLKFSQGAKLAQAMRATDEAPVVRLVAAWLLVRFFGREFLPEALAVFRETIGLSQRHYVLVEWMKHHEEFVGSISDVLRPFPEARLQWLIDMLHHPNPDIRDSAVWESKDVCHKRRSAPALLIPHLVPLLDDADAAICRSVVSLLFDLSLDYPVLTEPLENLRNHPLPAIREQAATAYKEQEKNRNVLIPPAWLDALLKPMRGKDLPELISILEEKLSSRIHTHSHECGSAIACLIQMGTNARPAAPVLHQALAHESAWVRVLAARALWKIERDAASIVPILLRCVEEFADTSFISDCFADMGRHAQAALPILQYIFDAEERWSKFAPDPLVIRIDELYRASARQAIERIQADMAAASNPDSSSS